jgi:hypothetical protein
MSRRSSTAAAELERHIATLEYYGPLLTAAGISTKNLDAFSVNMLALGPIVNDPEVKHRVDLELARGVDVPMQVQTPEMIEVDIPATPDTYALTLRVLRNMNAAERHAVRSRVKESWRG